MEEADQDRPAEGQAPPGQEQVKLYASDAGHAATSFPGHEVDPTTLRAAGPLGRIGARCRAGLRCRPLVMLGLAALAGATLGALVALGLTRRRWP